MRVTTLVNAPMIDLLTLHVGVWILDSHLLQGSGQFRRRRVPAGNNDAEASGIIRPIGVGALDAEIDASIVTASSDVAGIGESTVGFADVPRKREPMLRVVLDLAKIDRNVESLRSDIDHPASFAVVRGRLENDEADRDPILFQSARLTGC